MSGELVERPSDALTESSFQTPAIVLAEAKQAARALKDVLTQKPNPFIINDEQYLEFEDLQLLGRFYKITAKVVYTEPLYEGDASGYLAKAVAIQIINGQPVEISGAESMCMDDEGWWGDKPRFQRRSMAQTRACAKALRNVLAWVVVLAGYKPTPAEEMPETGKKLSPQSTGNYRPDIIYEGNICALKMPDGNKKPGRIQIRSEGLGDSPVVSFFDTPAELKDQDPKMMVDCFCQMSYKAVVKGDKTYLNLDHFAFRPSPATHEQADLRLQEGGPY